MATPKKPTGRRSEPLPPLDPEKIKAIMDEDHEPHEDPVKIWPLSAEEALKRALSTPLDVDGVEPPKGSRRQRR